MKRNVFRIFLFILSTCALFKIYWKISSMSKRKQEAIWPHRFPEKTVQSNKHIEKGRKNLLSFFFENRMVPYLNKLESLSQTSLCAMFG